jgi:CHAT domain-containing protein
VSRRLKGVIVIAIGTALIAGLVVALYVPFQPRRVVAETALKLAEARYPPDDVRVADALYDLADAYLDEQRGADAEPLLKRALAIRIKALGPASPELRLTIGRLGSAYLWMGRPDLARLLTSIAIQGFPRPPDSGMMVRNLYYTVRDGHDVDPQVRNAAFRVAQQSLDNAAAQALIRMAQRAVADPELRELIRQSQDLDDRRRELISDALKHIQQDPAAPEFVERLQDFVETSDRAVAVFSRMQTLSPALAFFIDPSAQDISEVQKYLAADEALVVYLDTSRRIPSGDTYFFVVTPIQSRWGRVNTTGKELQTDVDALRCGLDYEGAWGAASNCADLVGSTYSLLDHSLGKPLPFDIGRAHHLYQTLFGSIEDLIKDKQLLVVPSGPLTQLPFAALVTEKPDVPANAVVDFRDVAWLVRKHAVTILPAISSLKALRARTRESRASEQFIGFGDPLRIGDPEQDKDDAAAAKLAAELHCAKTEPIARTASAERGSQRAAVRPVGGRADATLDFAAWPPLPDTADELCLVARDLGVDPATHLFLGTQASETEIKRLSADGTLAKYKIIHFATHGAVAGELSGTAEPGLILTPPEPARDADDGYLSASEVAALKLDADWVILSACNTAAGQAKDAEALSGLARAFFYAGARSALVSHWPVNSHSTVSLITGAIGKLQADPKIGRAEAQRRAMLAMIEGGERYEAHPTFWAPFVLVGEGGAAR